MDAVREDMEEARVRTKDAEDRVRQMREQLKEEDFQSLTGQCKLLFSTSLTKSAQHQEKKKKTRFGPGNVVVLTSGHFQ